MAGVSVEVDTVAAAAAAVVVAMEVEDISKYVFEQFPLLSNWAGAEVGNSKWTCGSRLQQQRQNTSLFIEKSKS